MLTSRAEARRVILSRTAEAEELVSEIEEIFKKEQLSEADLIRARTLRNQMERSLPAEEEEKVRLEPADIKTLKAGDKVFLQSLNAEGTVLSVNPGKGEAQVQSGFMQVRCKIKELFLARRKEEKKGAASRSSNICRSGPSCRGKSISSGFPFQRPCRSSTTF